MSEDANSTSQASAPDASQVEFDDEGRERSSRGAARDGVNDAGINGPSRTDHPDSPGQDRDITGSSWRYRSAVASSINRDRLPPADTVHRVHMYPRGFVVQQAGLDEVPVDDARNYIVTDGGDLILIVGDREVARFGAGSWTSIRQVGVQLRDQWPPDDFDYLMSELGERLVVGYGLDFRYPLEPFRDPIYNDFNAFVDALTEREGALTGMDSEYRRWIASAVAEVFKVDG